MSKLRKTIIIGLSGPSCSGKSTLARLLRDIYNISVKDRSIHLFILHEDDFYKTDAEIPTITTPSNRTLQDWDSASSLDLPLLSSTLTHIHTHGTLPPDLLSKEDQNEIGDNHVPASTVTTLNSNATTWLERLNLSSEDALEVQICILEGFLLYPDPSSPSIPDSITSRLTLRLFLRCTYAQASSRRIARKGYVTLEGFWEDPPGYVDEVVWPNYVREHGWMFEEGDVDHGDVKREAEEGTGGGILVGPGNGEKGMDEIVGWGCEVLEREVGKIVKGGS